MSLEQDKYYCIILIEEPILSFNLFATNEEDVFNYVNSNFESQFYFVSFTELTENEELLKGFVDVKNEIFEKEIISANNVLEYFHNNAKEGKIYFTNKYRSES